MPVATPPAVRLAIAWAGVFVVGFALFAQPPVDPKSPPVAPAPKESPSKPPPIGLKLPDGTFPWTGPGTGADGERVLLTPQEHQKLLDQIDELKKQLAARKGAPPSGCAIRGKIEKRGDTVVAALKATFAFRTTIPNAAVSLGGKRAFLVAATLDGTKLPILDTGEDGFAAWIEVAGDHTLVLDLECPVTGRGAKTEIGFELGLPRAAITTLALEAPAGATRFALATRTPDASQPMKPPEPRRVANLDAKALVATAGHDGYPLGPIDSLEVSWEPVAAAVSSDAVQSAEIDATCLLAEGFVETTARFRLRGSARSWRLAFPADATVTVDRIAASTTPDPVDSPSVTKPTDAANPVWKVDLPMGTSAADWVVTAVVRVSRPKLPDPKHNGPFAVGPFAVLDVSRTSGSVRATTAANTRLIGKHGPELRQEALPAPVSDDESAVHYRLATGPSGAAPPPTPLLTIETQPLAGKVAIRPSYKLTLTEAGWSVRAELRVFPIRTAIDAVTIELPSGWRGPEVSPPEIVTGSKAVASDGSRQVLEVKLAAEHKQPFDLVLTASVPFPPMSREATVSLPRYPNALERDAAIAATVPEGLEVRGDAHEWDGEQPAAWGKPLSVVPGADGKPPKGVAAIGGKFDRGVAKVDLTWSPYRPPLTADVRTEIVVHDGQLIVSERVRLRSAEGLPRSVHFRGAGELKSLPPFDALGAGEWAFAPPADAKDATLAFEYAVPLPPRPTDGSPRKIPLALVLPTGATRTESIVRVWVASGTGRTVSVEPGAWREQPPEPVPERDALPALTLAGSGADLPLILDLRDSGETGAASVWVERGLIQAWVGDDGTVYRARFLLRRWLSDAVEVRLPEALASANSEVYLDEPARRANATLVSAEGPDRVLRVPLPEAKPGRVVVLDIRYKLPSGPGDAILYVAPRPNAAFAGPVRWQVTGPSGTVPLVLGGGRAEQRWRSRFGMILPIAASADDLDKWFQTGTADDSGNGAGETAVVRLSGPEPLHVYHFSRLNLTIGCSAAVLLLGLIVAQLPGGIAGPLLALLAGGAAVAAVLYPQPAAQVAGAAGPGLAVLALVFAVRTAAKRYYRQRVTYLPGFARTRPQVLPMPSSASGGSRPSDRSRPSANGSTGPADAGVPVPQPAPSGS